MNYSYRRWVAGIGIKLLPGVLLVFLLAFCWGCSSAMADDPKTVDKMEISGTISVKGAGPHTFLCLRTDSGVDYRLEGVLRDTIWNRFQQEEIRLKGVISKEAVGPGHPAVFTIHKIVSPEP